MLHAGMEIKPRSKGILIIGFDRKITK